MQSSNFISDKTQSQSSAFLKESYDQFLSEIREDVGEGETSQFLSDDFQQEFKELVFHDELDHFSAKKFYWLNLIDSLVDTLFLLEEGDYSAESIIEYFEASEFLGFIITELEMDQPPQEVISAIKEIQEFQIISYFHLQIAQSEWTPAGPVAYRPVPELGEGSHGLYLGANNDFYPLPDDIDSTVLPIVNYNPKHEIIQIDLEGEILEINNFENKLISTDSSPVLLINHEVFNNTAKENIYSKYIKANNIIATLCPDLYKNLNLCTDFVIPLEVEEVVSYSMKVLPKYSCINIFNRDLVDLVDDLLHENGHHYLNGLLEGEQELIFEDDEKIFYSPWRRSLRPIRGLYHGVLTFYWAYRLFKELSFSEHSHQFFTKDQMAKIYFRLLEEEFLILACKDELNRAHDLGKISDFGKSFYIDIISEIEHDREKCSTVQSSLLQDKYQIQLENLKKDVLEKRALKA